MSRKFCFLMLILNTIPGITQYQMDFSSNQNDFTQPVSAWVFPDSGLEKTYVDNLKLEFVFSGYGVYIESDYPVLDYIPLENGEKVDLTSIQWVEFTGKRVTWKQYVDPADRSQYDNVDAEGYRQWSQIEVECSIKDRFGQLINSRIKRPEISDIYLKGKTRRGSFDLQLDQENGKTIRLIMDKSVYVICSKNPAHRFKSQGWKYCPLCGSPLLAPEKMADK